MQQDIEDRFPSRMAGGVEERYQSAREVQREFMRETDRIRKAFLDRIEQLRLERLKLREQASYHAGKLGLVYSADTNTFARLVVADHLPDVTPPKALLTSRLIYTQDSIHGNAEDIQDAEFSDVTDDEVNPPESNSADEPTSSKSENTESLPSGQVEREAGAQLIERPAPPLPPELPTMSLTIEPHSGKSWQDIVGKSFAWLFAVLVGLFVGYGFDKLLDLSKYNFTTGDGNLIILLSLLSLGVALICGLKLLFETIWKLYGEAKRHGHASQAWFFSCVVLTTVFVIVEALVTLMAFDAYFKAVSLTGTSTVPWWVLFIMSLGVASPNLLFSAFQGYAKGIRTHSQAELDRKLNQIQMERYEAERAYQDKAYEEELARWREIRSSRDELQKAEAERQEELRRLQHQLEVDRIQREQEVQLAWRQHQLAIFQRRGELAEGSITLLDERREKMETFRNEPDFQALNQCISMINSITQEMNEIKEAMTNIMISRGHMGKSVF